MNPNNYCTLEAAQRLQAAGIEIEPEQHFYIQNEPFLEWYYLPRPCFTEVWRELPESIKIGNSWYHLGVEKTSYGKDTYVYYGKDTYVYYREQVVFENENPTDALIDLLIWVRKEKDHER